MTEPLLRADGARIAIGGATAIASLSLVTRGDRVVLGGDAAALMQVLLLPGSGLALAGDDWIPPAAVVAGTVSVQGQDVGRGEQVTATGLAALDPPMPGSWRIEEYLRWAGRLSGLGRRAARDAATASLERLRMHAGRRRVVRSLKRVERRAVALAQALVGDPAVLICERPFANLGAQEAAFLAPLLERASASRATVVSVDRLVPPGPEAELARTATDICVLRGGELVAHAAPGELWGGGAVAEVTVRRHGPRLHERLLARGATVRGGPTHYAVTLPDGMSLTDLLGIAASVAAPVVRCTPLLG